jgi:hypothetical protein
LHLHWGKKDSEGSEHLVDGTRFSAEAHLVTSYNDGAKIAVIARFFKVVSNMLSILYITYLIGNYLVGHNMGAGGFCAHICVRSNLMSAHPHIR